MVTEVESRLSAHEQVCAERYAVINTRLDGVDARLKRLERVIMNAAAVLLVGMGSMIATIVMKV
jgi:hypothetical protein